MVKNSNSKTVLVTQIGKPKITDDGEYQKTTYQLDGKQFETAMISFGLADILKPDLVLLLGTSASAWSGLISMHHNILNLPGATDLHHKLEQLEKEDSVRDDDLEKLSDYLNADQSIEFACRVTPYLDIDTVRESAEYMLILSEFINSDDSIYLDITHGLRHHPMLILVAAQYFQTVLNASIEGIYYGMFERKRDDVTTVLSLKGILNLLNWVHELKSFDKDGDYSGFGELMKQDGVEIAVCESISRAGYYERISNSVGACEQLAEFKKTQFSKTKTPLTSLFEGALRDRVKWSDKGSRGDKEILLAELYLRRRDYLRACIYALEGGMSKYMYKEKLDLNDYSNREEWLRNNGKQGPFDKLRPLRNAMAHGLPGSEDETKNILKDERKLQNELKKMLNKLKKSMH